MSFKNAAAVLVSAFLFSLLFVSCAAPRDDSQQKIAVIVALTQTAYAAGNPPAPEASAPPPSGYLPLGKEECAALNNSLSSAAGYPGAITSPVPFEDFQTGQAGSGCEIKFQTTGLEMENFEPLVSPLTSALAALGWMEDMAYGAGGAGGYATAFRKDDTLCLTLVESKPSDPALCPADQPMAVCWQNLAPQQKTFHLTLNCARHVP